MTETLVLLVGTFAGGAMPWLEAVVVIPGAILAGLDPASAVVSAVAGNLLTIALSAWFGERVVAWWRRRRAAERSPGDHAPAVADSSGSGAAESPIGRPDPMQAPGDAGGSSRERRAERVLARWGLPALAALGPVVGTQFSAVVAVGAGLDARRVTIWIGAGTLVWGVAAAIVTAAGLSVAGLGA